MCSSDLLAGGVGAAFGLAQLRTTYPTAQRLERATGLPVIGSVSEIVSEAERALRQRKLRLFAAAAFSAATEIERPALSRRA